MQRAKVDHEGIYWGPEEVAALAPDDIPAPDDAIRPGAYRWYPAKHDAAGLELDCGHWVPLEPRHVKLAPQALSAERALYEQLRHAHQRDPASVAELAAAWCRQFETSWDADNGQTLFYFRNLAAGKG